MVGMIYRHAKTLGKFNVSFQQAVASAERIFEIMDVQPEIYDAPDAVSLPKIRGDVVFKDVSFAYDSQAPVLNHINLKVNAGESIALVGHSGVGKTTMVNLLTRFYDVTDGEITVDGHPISKITLKSLRQQVGLVPQETVIFGGTVRENVEVPLNLAGTGGASARQQAESLLTRLGMEHRLHAKPPTLSGGERQSVAIARAVYFGAKVLILDEPTAALGVKQAGVVLKYIIQAKNRGIGVIFITHNPQHAYPVGDHFVILRRGQVYGDFSKEELPLEQLVQMMAGGADLEALKHELEEASQQGGAGAAALAETAEAIGSEISELGETPGEQGES